MGLVQGGKSSGFGIHYLMNRGRYAPEDLHAFAIPGARGSYWYTNGLNPRALFAWACGVLLALLFSTTSLFTGSLESSVKGVDLSWLMGALGGGVVYLALTLLAPDTKRASERAIAPMSVQDVSTTP